MGLDCWKVARNKPPRSRAELRTAAHSMNLRSRGHAAPLLVAVLFREQPCLRRSFTMAPCSECAAKIFVLPEVDAGLHWTVPRVFAFGLQAATRHALAIRPRNFQSPAQLDAKSRVKEWPTAGGR